MFLVGARRSGTRWLQGMVCAHPEAVAIPSETHLFSHGLAPLADRFQHATALSPKTAKVFLPRSEMRDLLRDVADRVLGGVATAVRPQARLIVERTPWHAFHLDLIAEVYPDASVIHIIRDGRDVARSLLAQEWGPTTMQAAAEEWRSTVLAARSSAGRLERYREVRYEDLLADPAGRLRELLAWLDLDTSAEVMTSVLSDAGFGSGGDVQAQRAWAGRSRAKMAARDARKFDRVAGELQGELGYERLAPPSRFRAAADLVQPSIATTRRRAGAPTRSPVASSRAGMPRLDRPYEPQVRSIALMERIQALLDDLVSAFERGDAQLLGELVGPGATVRHVRDDLDEGGRGEAQRRSFLSAVAEAGAVRRPHAGSEVHPGVPISVVVLRYVAPSGHVESDTLVVGVSGEVIDSVIWYRTGGMAEHTAGPSSDRSVSTSPPPGTAKERHT